MRMLFINCLTILLIICSFELYADASENNTNEAQIYRSPEERREAGLGTKLNEWMSVSGLVEVEKTYIEDRYSNSIRDKNSPRPLANLQLSLDVSINDWLSAEFILDSEYDFDARGEENKLHTAWDEAFIELSLGDGTVKVGRQYYPFGEYYSHFVTGPVLEFSETNGNGIVIDYSINDSVEISGFLLESNVDKYSNREQYDWGSSIEYISNNDSIRIGAGYLSDLSESDEGFITDDNRYENKVSAWNAYLLFGFDLYEVTAEIVLANQRFKEFEANENKPFAYNLEFAYFVSPQIQFALRYEHSEEFGGGPLNQYGIANTWAPNNNLAITMEYLHGNFESNFIFDENDNELKNRAQFSLEISIQF